MEISKPNIKVENTIRFKRLTSQNITGYLIHVKEEIRENVYAEYDLAVVDNPVSPNPIPYQETRESELSFVFQLPENTYFSPSHRVKVYVDGTEIEDKYITFNDYSKVVRISNHSIIKPKGEIKFKYFKDVIEVKHSATNKCLYTVKTILNKNFLYGEHTIVR